MEQLILPGVLLELCFCCKKNAVGTKQELCQECVSFVVGMVLEPDKLPPRQPLDAFDF